MGRMKFGWEPPKYVYRKIIDMDKKTLAWLLNEVYYKLYNDMLSDKCPSWIYERFKELKWEILKNYNIGSLDNKD